MNTFTSYLLFKFSLSIASVLEVIAAGQLLETLDITNTVSFFFIQYNPTCT